METTRYEPFIETYTGRRFFFLNPNPDDIDYEDIAHALSNNCRYTGHSREFYSVAEHSVYVSRLCSTDNALVGLLHDSAEAYLTDIASPIKPYLTNYKDMENVLLTAILMKHGLETTFPDEIKKADLQQLSTEAYYLLPSKGLDPRWGNGAWGDESKRPPVEDGYKPVCYNPRHAKDMWLAEYERLMSV